MSASLVRRLHESAADDFERECYYATLADVVGKKCTPTATDTESVNAVSPFSLEPPRKSQRFSALVSSSAAMGSRENALAPVGTPSGYVSFGIAGLLQPRSRESTIERVGNEAMGTFVSARDILAEGLPSTRYIFEGFATEWAREPRTMPNRFGSPSKKVGQPENCVLEVALCDFTGPVLVNLWGDLAVEFLHKVASVQPPVTMRLTNYQGRPAGT